MRGTLKLTCYKLIRLSEFKGTCFKFEGENYLSMFDGDDGDCVVCVNLSGPTIVTFNSDTEIQPIDLEIKEL